jgi:hypothetical protein
MRRVSTTILLGGLVLSAASVARAQDRAFDVGSTYVGPVIGFGSLGGASVAFGGRIEHGFWKVPSLGDGVIGIMASVDWYHWDCGVGGVDCGVTWIPIGVTGNYHFKINSEKFDAYIGAGLGYYITSCSGAGGCGGLTSVYFIGRAGGRYNFTPNLGLYADVGAGAAAINVGIMFNIGSKR